MVCSPSCPLGKGSTASNAEQKDSTTASSLISWAYEIPLIFLLYIFILILFAISYFIIGALQRHFLNMYLFKCEVEWQSFWVCVHDVMLHGSTIILICVYVFCVCVYISVQVRFEEPEAAGVTPNRCIVPHQHHLRGQRGSSKYRHGN